MADDVWMVRGFVTYRGYPDPAWLDAETGIVYRTASGMYPHGDIVAATFRPAH